MTAKKPMTREEIERGLEEYQRRREEKKWGWGGTFVNPHAVLPVPDLSDLWAVILEREKAGLTLQ